MLQTHTGSDKCSPYQALQCNGRSKADLIWPDCPVKFLPYLLVLEGWLAVSQEGPLTEFEWTGWIRKLSEEEYQDWAELHNRAEQALEKRDKLLMESYNR
jgi:hypothetical protein